MKTLAYALTGALLLPVIVFGVAAIWVLILEGAHKISARIGIPADAILAFLAMMFFGAVAGAVLARLLGE